MKDIGIFYGIKFFLRKRLQIVHIKETVEPVSYTHHNCDLSASYNIGARYFIRELLKPLPVTESSLLEIKESPVNLRTSCVYADLRKLHSEMELLKAA